EADELSHGRIERPTGGLVHIDVGVAHQGIAAIAYTGGGQRNRRAIGRRRDREDLDVGIRVALRPVRIHAGTVDVHEGTPADGVLVLADRLVHALTPDLVAIGVRRGLFLLHDLVEARIPLVRPVHDVALEAHREA